MLNLERIKKLKAEPPDQREFDGLVRSARRSLADAEKKANASESRFILAYDAAHSLASAALRWHGFRSADRYTVFQVLAHTVNFPNEKWRLLDDCHQKRNAALYDGNAADDELLIEELIVVTKDLQIAVIELGPVRS